MTIAFSEKFNSWTTRYSFEPTCYSTTGNRMVSFNDNGDVWLHDSNPIRCNFYGLDEGSSLEVVSNQDPSAIKIFKSLSIETNGSGWSGKVYTNDEYSPNERQEGDILSSFFKNKEGFKYSEMPRSKVNSSVIQPVGISSNIDYATGDSGTYSSLITNYISALPAQQSILPQDDGTWHGIFIVDGAPTIDVNPTLYFEIPFLSLATDFLIPGSTPVVVSENGDLTLLDKIKFSRINKNNAISFGGNPTSLSVVFSCKINDFETLFVGAPVLSGISNYIATNFYGPPLALNTVTTRFGRNLISQSNSEVEGDQMRGPYARVKLETPTTDPIEIHAINVDYEFSKLDKRLTQNS